MDIDFLKGGNVASGIAIGIGASILIPVAGRVFAGIGKPLVKETIKGGMLLNEKSRGLFAQTREALSDLGVEAKSEYTSGKASGGKTSGKKSTTGAKS
jgi:hypothetical protein